MRLLSFYPVVVVNILFIALFWKLASFPTKISKELWLCRLTACNRTGGKVSVSSLVTSLCENARPQEKTATIYNQFFHVQQLTYIKTSWAFSTFSSVWYFQMLSANFDMNSAQYNEAPTPFIARYVRFEPKFWYNEICLRVEIYGCDGKLSAFLGNQ